MNIYQQLTNKVRKGQKSFAVLVDPDKYSVNQVKSIAKKAEKAGVPYIFYGGSLITTDHYENYIRLIKDNCSIPVILFPGSHFQLSRKADAILLLSLISGRNPEMLIGKHVIAAPYLKLSKLEIIPTGYILVESKKATAVSYMSGTTPIPGDKDDIAVCTAMAGEMLGLRTIYLDAGSGAQNHVPLTMIRKVKSKIGVPLIIGGGINSAGKAKKILDAGADIVVVGNAIEKDNDLIFKIAEKIS